jgi:hypothetical protein
MKVELGKFARTAIEAHAGGDLEAGVVKALRHYARIGGSEPRLAPLSAHGGWPSGSQRCTQTVELSVDPHTEAALRRAVGAASPGQLGAHAVLVYLADLDRPGAEVPPPIPRS